MTRKITLLILISNAFICVSQNDSIARNKLEEVLVVGKKQKKEIVLAQKTVTITNEQLLKNPTNLTELLRYASPITFIDYGNGGTSTARFRGTSSTNTLVLWNGIPINAVGNGQTDFNSLSSSLSDEITVKSGGSSSENGSGAIGGTVNLKDHLEFKEHQKFQLFGSYGDFNTTSNFFKTNLGTNKWAIKLSSSINYSDNDYTFIDDRYKDANGNLLKNENGTYENYGISFALGYKISEVNKLFFYTTGYQGDRLFSDGLPNPSAGSEKYEDKNQRNLLKWQYQFARFKQIVNLSYLTQDYRYYLDKDAEDFTFGNSDNFNLDYTLKYKYNNKVLFNITTAYQEFKGETKDINEKREVISLVADVVYKPSLNTTTKLSVRKESNSDFKVPLSVFGGIEQKIFNKVLLKGNIATNYRVPTFNELYWPQSGNLDLIPETASQGELGLEFTTKKVRFNSAVFYIRTKDKILWLPTGRSNIWRPINIDDVENKGIETYANYTTNLGDNNIQIGVNYSYTIARNITEDSFLPFVPKHFFNLNASFSRAWWKLYIQSLYQSQVYTNNINIDFYSLDSVFVNNAGIDFNILNKKEKQLTIGAKVNNILNEVYYFTNLRPMPGRNYNVNINYKF